MERLIYRLAGPVNTIQGHPAFLAVGTDINWEVIGADPGVISENCARVKGRFIPNKDFVQQEPAAVVGYGQSLYDTWRDLHNFKVIFTCSGSHKFLLDRGIVPTYHVDSDPRAHKVAMLGTPHPDVTYLVASICHPTYFDLLERHGIEKVLLWHLLVFDPHVYEMLPKGEWLWTGGNTVGPRAMKMARLLGYRTLHMFGFDACDGYAGYHQNAPKNLKPFLSNGKTFWSTHNWFEHAKMMFEDMDRMPEVTYQFHGEGLIQEMAKRYVRKVRNKFPMGVMK